MKKLFAKKVEVGLLIIGQALGFWVVQSFVVHLIFPELHPGAGPLVVFISIAFISVVAYLFVYGFPKEAIKYTSLHGYQRRSDQSAVKDTLIVGRCMQFLVPIMGIIWYFRPPQVYLNLCRVLGSMEDEPL